MILRLIVGETILRANLYDNPTTTSFLAQLPLTLDLTDYAGTEKVSSDIQPLTTDGTPTGEVYGTNDIIYFKPWNNLCICYNVRQTTYNGVYKIGTLLNGIENFQVSGIVRVTFELETEDQQQSTTLNDIITVTTQEYFASKENEQKESPHSYKSSEKDNSLERDDGGDNKLNTGEIIGIIIGCIAFIVIVLVIIIVIRRRKAKSSDGLQL